MKHPHRRSRRPQKKVVAGAVSSAMVAAFLAIFGVDLPTAQDEALAAVLTLVVGFAGAYFAEERVSE